MATFKPKDKVKLIEDCPSGQIRPKKDTRGIVLFDEGENVSVQFDLGSFYIRISVPANSISKTSKIIEY